MKRILTAEQMKKCDSYTIETVGIPSRELMQRAADAAFREIMSSGLDLTKVLCICGTGNNGGDGLAVAMLLHESGVKTEFFVCGDVSRMTEECAYRYDVLKKEGVNEQTELELAGVTLVVDGLLGIGITGDVRDEAADVIDLVAASGVPVAALDIPSGVNADTGGIMGRALTAQLTIAFARLKAGHLLYPGRKNCGRTMVADIGIGEDGISDDALIMELAEIQDIKKLIPHRDPHSHKGTYGRVLTVAGSEGMCGAAYFSALASYRSGAGLVEVFTPKANLPIIQTRLPEAIVTGWADNAAVILSERLKAADSCVIGPGLGKGSNAAELVKVALVSDLPLVADADALNLIAECDELKGKLRMRTAPTVITPHAAEMSRLCGVSISDVLHDPVKISTDFSKEYGVVCVMKNSATVVAMNDRVFINNTGSSALAKGGSGDVLTGIIGAFLAAGKDALTSATAGVYIHGLSGELAAEELSEYSVLATDTADHIGKAIKKIMQK
ncbi:MAG: NAD(P)H-hydrate dehydratase [Ruminococcaceae bacterium]|nr:NAD(P)H-hydrate dehydratase [Oscillospiraceae bacterium]